MNPTQLKWKEGHSLSLSMLLLYVVTYYVMCVVHNRFVLVTRIIAKK